MKEKTLKFWIIFMDIFGILLVYDGIWNNLFRWQLIASGIFSLLIAFVLYLIEPTPLQKNRGYNHD